MDLPNYAGFSIRFLHRLLPSATRPPAAGRPRHARPTRRHKVLSANGPQHQTRRAGGVERRKEPCRGRLARSPGTERTPRENRGFKHFRSRFPPGNFSVVSPGWGFNCKEVVFSGMNIIIPSGICFCIPVVFQYVRAAARIILRGGRGFQLFGGVSLPGFIFVSLVRGFNYISVRGFNCMGGF